MNKTIGLLAHVDAGKTTFSEQLLYHTKTIKQKGRVDHKDAYLDSHTIEKQRGITVFADQGIANYNDSTYYFIDTPGHVDFSPEMERAIQIMDYAVLIISAVEGVEGHTETVWQLLQKYNVPTFLFINKTDRTGANVQVVLQDLRKNVAENVCELTDSLSGRGMTGDEVGQLPNGGESGEEFSQPTSARTRGNKLSQLATDRMGEELLEWIAERNEILLENYLSGELNPELWLFEIRKMIHRRDIFPVMSGSALQDNGVLEFLQNLDLLTFTDYESSSAPFVGQVYKIRHDENGTRLTFVKALLGTLGVRREISYRNKEKIVTEKVTQLRTNSGTNFEQVNTVEAGELFSLVGLSEASVGDMLYVDEGAAGQNAIEKWKSSMVSTLKSKVILHTAIHIKEALKFFKILDAEDPSLHVLWDEALQEIHIHVMGTVQLEVLQQLVKDRFDLEVEFGDPEILYKETIESTVVGYGHFEPLKHYAEVHLKIEAEERGSGVTVANCCHADDLSIGNQNLVLHHLTEREHHGLLTGSSLTDVSITLLTGAAHNKHTHGGDFREATYRALRQGLEKAENVLLEPFYSFKIKVDVDLMGRVITDVQNASGVLDAPVVDEEKAVLTGRVPVSTFMNYSTELASFTKGRGSISIVVSGYDRCHNAEEVIERIGYRKDADPEYSSSSVFCAKGKGYTVPWDEAEKYMHLK